MTDREKAIVMARTGIVMLTGDRINEFYKYLSELYGRPVYTHEIVALDIKEKSMPDFIRLCREEQPERVYCLDCKYYDTEECMGRNAFYGLKDDDYCSWAERKEKDETD
jgi:hypothetical protein